MIKFKERERANPLKYIFYTGSPPPAWDDALTLLGRYQAYPLLYQAARVKDRQGTLYPNTVFCNDPKGECPVVKSVTTAAVSKHQMFFSRSFCDELPAAELAFVILHETLHWLRKDPYNYQDILAGDNKLNVDKAIEYRINADIVNALKARGAEDRITMPEGAAQGLYSDTFKNPEIWDIFRIAKCLPSDEPPPEGLGDINPDEDSSGEDSSDEDSSGEPDMDEKESRLDRLEQMTQMAQQTPTAHLPKEVKSEAQELASELYRGPDPLTLIKRFACSPAKRTFTYDQIDQQLRRYAMLPTRAGHTVGNVLVILDVSGSVLMDDMFPKILGCIRSIGQKAKHVDMVTFDTQVQDYLPDIDKLKKSKDLTFRPTGGGTRLTPPLAWLRTSPDARCRKYKSVIFLTDGYGSIDLQEPRPSQPLLWVLCGEYATKRHIPESWRKRQMFLVMPNTKVRG